MYEPLPLYFHRNKITRKLLNNSSGKVKLLAQGKSVPYRKSFHSSSKTLLSQTLVFKTCLKHIVVVVSPMLPEVTAKVFFYLEINFKKYTFKMYIFLFLPLCCTPLHLCQHWWQPGQAPRQMTGTTCIENKKWMKTHHPSDLCQDSLEGMVRTLASPQI